MLLLYAVLSNIITMEQCVYYIQLNLNVPKFPTNRDKRVGQVGPPTYWAVYIFDGHYKFSTSRTYCYSITTNSSRQKSGHFMVDSGHHIAEASSHAITSDTQEVVPQTDSLVILNIQNLVKIYDVGSGSDVGEIHAQYLLDNVLTGNRKSLQTNLARNDRSDSRDGTNTFQNLQISAGVEELKSEKAIVGTPENIQWTNRVEEIDTKISFLSSVITDLREIQSQGSRRDTNSKSSFSDSDENLTEHTDSVTKNRASFWCGFLCGSSNSCNKVESIHCKRSAFIKRIRKFFWKN